jgi:hypothetical protein
VSTTLSPRRPAFAASIVKPLAAIILLAGAAGAATMLLGKSETPVVDQSPVERLKLIAEAEASFTYTLAFGQMVAPRCGEVEAPALAAASETEKASDPAMAALASKRAAARARNITTAKSCGRARFEVEAADKRARAAHY